MTTKILASASLMLAAGLVVSEAQTNPPTAATPAPELSATEQTIHDIKNPTSWFNWGGDIRLRNEYFNNGLSLTESPKVSPLFSGVHEQDYWRFRGRVWASATPVEDLSLNARLAAEPREFMKNSTFDTYFNGEGLQARYGILDDLNVKWNKPLGLPATLTVGRQDIFLGDGWLVGDGTPNDGSFTFFLDSARLNVDLKDQKTTIDAIGIVQYARPDAWLPTIGQSSTVGGPGPEPLSLTDQNEKGAILWVANKSIPAANFDGYFIYKHDTRINDAPNPPFGLLFGDNADIYTLGGRVSGALCDHFSYSAEGAYQFGHKEDPFLNGFINGNNPLLSPSAQRTGFRDLSAFGVNSKLTYSFKDDLNTKVGVNYEFLSGDDPNSAKDGMFDILWGRWPRWSEVYNIYSYVQETRVGQTANLHRIGPTVSLDPIKDMNFSFSYFALLADQKVPTRSDYLAELGLVATHTGAPTPGVAAPSPFSRSGTFRGHYLQAVLKYKFSQHVSGHLWSEFIFPGDYYVSKEMISFLRAELLFTF